MKLGAHMPTAGGIYKAIERGIQLQCQCIQIFVKNNLQWFGKPYEPSDLAKFASELARDNAPMVFGHTGYLINLAAPNSENRKKSLHSLAQEIQFSTTLGLPFLVMHPGAHLNQGEEKGLEQIIAGLNEVFAATIDSPVKIALENTAGQGTCLGHQLEHLNIIMQGVNFPNRLGICIDTAHLYAAGYDITQRKGWDCVIDRIMRLFGLNRLLAVHLNDSKAALNSRVDRHAGIGKGFIGIETFRQITNDDRLADKPGCLETPKSPDLHEDKENLALLHSLCVDKKLAKKRLL
jgi:deoxyribonuclease-4